GTLQLDGRSPALSVADPAASRNASDHRENSPLDRFLILLTSLDTAQAMIAAPSSPDGLAEASGCTPSLAADDRCGCVRHPGFGVLAGRHDRGGTTGDAGIMAPAHAEGTVGGDAGDILIRRDRVERFWQHRCVAEVAAGAFCR